MRFISRHSCFLPCCNKPGAKANNMFGIFGNQKIDFTKPLQDIEPELIPEMSNITPQFANDGVHDQQGRMVMNITDDKIYNKFGRIFLI
jgi:hypothetical protein